MLIGGATAEIELLSKQMRECWINFVRHGDPNHDAIPTWAAHQIGTNKFMSFDATVKTDDWELMNIHFHVFSFGDAEAADTLERG